MNKLTFQITILASLLIASCNFGGTNKKERFYGDKSAQFKAKSYNDFYNKYGRAPRKDEKKEIDHWADSLKNVGGIMNNTEYSTEYGTKETEKTILKKQTKQ